MMHAPWDDDDNDDDDDDDDDVERNLCVDGDGENRTKLLHPELKWVIHYRAKVDQSWPTCQRQRKLKIVGQSCEFLKKWPYLGKCDVMVFRREAWLRVGMWKKSKSFLLSFKAKCSFQSTRGRWRHCCWCSDVWCTNINLKRKSGLLMRKLKVGFHQAGQHQNRSFCVTKMYSSGWFALSTIYYLSALWHCVCTVDIYKRVHICQAVSCSPPHIIYHPRPSLGLLHTFILFFLDAY